MTLRPTIELAIALPFSIDAYGTIAATVDQAKIWADRVRSVIGTAVGERVMRPEFGCEAALNVFEPEESTVAILEDDIRRAFITFLPLCGLNGVSVSVNDETRVITAEVEYSTPNSESYLLQVGIATLNGTNPISEEITWQRL